jgi:hypothetical protein
MNVTSDEFPELPELGLTLPSGWERADGPGLLTALAPATEHGFRANVLLSTARRDAPVQPAWVADGVRRGLDRLPEVRFVHEKEVQVDGLPGRLFRVTWRHPEAGTLVQSVLTVPIPLGPLVHVIELVGTLGAERIEEDAVAVDQVLRSLRIVPAGAPPATS